MNAPVDAAQLRSFVIGPAIALSSALAGAACTPAGTPPAGAPAVASSTTQDRTGPCLTDEPRLIHYARWLASDPDPELDAIRRRYEIEPVAPSDVEQILDPAVCLQATSAYVQALDLTRSPDAVAVIRIGERYIVTSRAGTSASREFASAVVFDRSMRVVSTFRS